MSKDETGHTLDYAAFTAERVVVALRPLADRIEIAGSIRRGRDLVHDIDIVMLPKRTPSPQAGLFGAPEGKAETSTQEIERALATKVVPKIKKLFAWRGQMEANGPKIKKWKMLVLKGSPSSSDEDIFIKTDLYICYFPEWFQTLYLIRTGSVQHNIMMCARAKERGWTLHASGEGLFNRNGDMVANESEEAIFKALDMDYKEPSKREVLVTRTKKKGGKQA